MPTSISAIVVLWACYHSCNIMREVNPWFWKINMFSDNHVIITYLLKIARKSLLKHSFFVLKLSVTVNLKKCSSNTIFSWYTFRKLYMVWFNCFSGRPRSWKSEKEVLKYFWLTTMRVIYEIKILLVRIKKYLYQFHSFYTMQVSPRRVLHL